MGRTTSTCLKRMMVEGLLVMIVIQDPEKRISRPTPADKHAIPANTLLFETVSLYMRSDLFAIRIGTPIPVKPMQRNNKMNSDIGFVPLYNRNKAITKISHEEKKLA